MVSKWLFLSATVSLCVSGCGTSVQEIAPMHPVASQPTYSVSQVDPCKDPLAGKYDSEGIFHPRCVPDRKPSNTVNKNVNNNTSENTSNQTSGNRQTGGLTPEQLAEYQKMLELIKKIYSR